MADSAEPFRIVITKNTLKKTGGRPGRVSFLSVLNTQYGAIVIDTMNAYILIHRFKN